MLIARKTASTTDERSLGSDGQDPFPASNVPVAGAIVAPDLNPLTGGAVGGLSGASQPTLNTNTVAYGSFTQGDSADFYAFTPVPGASYALVVTTDSANPNIRSLASLDDFDLSFEDDLGTPLTAGFQIKDLDGKTKLVQFSMPADAAPDLTYWVQIDNAAGRPFEYALALYDVAQAPKISVSAGAPAADGTVKVTFTADQALFAGRPRFDRFDTQGGTLGNFVRQAAVLNAQGEVVSQSYTADFKPMPGAVLQSVRVLTGAFFDVDGNINLDGDEADNGILIRQEVTPPTLSIDISDVDGNGQLQAGETALVSFNFSEPVLGFTLEDIVLSAPLGQLSAFDGDGQSFVALFTPNANVQDTVTFSVNAGAVTDRAGNALAQAVSADLVLNTGPGGVDTTPPEAGPFTAATGATSVVGKADASDQLVLNFDTTEPVTGLTVDDFEVSAAGRIVALRERADSTAAGTQWAVVFDAEPVAQSTTVQVTLKPGAFQDAAGNSNTTGTGINLTVEPEGNGADTVAPTVVAFTADPGTAVVGLNNNNSDAVRVLITFSESVQGLAADDLVVNALNLDTDAVDEALSPAVLAITPVGQGDFSGRQFAIDLDPRAVPASPKGFRVSVDVKPGAVRDAAGNDSEAYAFPDAREGLFAVLDQAPLSAPGSSTRVAVRTASDASDAFTFVIDFGAVRVKGLDATDFSFEGFEAEVLSVLPVRRTADGVAPLESDRNVVFWSTWQVTVNPAVVPAAVEGRFQFGLIDGAVEDNTGTVWTASLAKANEALFSLSPADGVVGDTLISGPAQPTVAGFQFTATALTAAAPVELLYEGEVVQTLVSGEAVTIDLADGAQGSTGIYTVRNGEVEEPLITVTLGTGANDALSAFTDGVGAIYGFAGDDELTQGLGIIGLSGGDGVDVYRLLSGADSPATVFESGSPLVEDTSPMAAIFGTYTGFDVIEGFDPGLDVLALAADGLPVLTVRGTYDTFFSSVLGLSGFDSFTPSDTGADLMVWIDTDGDGVPTDAELAVVVVGVGESGLGEFGLVN